MKKLWKAPSRVLLFCGATLLCSYVPAHAALELYADFEAPSPLVPAIGGSNSQGRLNGEKPPAYVKGSPATLAKRSRGALRLSGEGFVYFQEVDAPELAEAWTLNTFINFDPKVRTPQTLVGRPGVWFWTANLSRNTITFNVSATKASAEFPLTAGLAGKWQMLTLVRSGENLEFFINGQSQGTRKLTGDIEPYGALYIGAASTKGGYGVHGTIDDLSVWSQALTPAQIQKLFSGTTAMEIASEGRLKRTPTPPITAQTPVYHLRSSMDASTAVIATPENGNPALAEKVRDALAKAWGIQLKIRPVAKHSDGTENVILLGAGMEHPLSRELAGNQQIVRNIKGSELRVYPEVLDWKRGVVYLGGRSDAEVLAAADELVKRFPKPNNLTFTIKAQPLPEVAAPDELVKQVRDLYASRAVRKNNLTITTHMQQAFNAYRASGDERYAKAFSEMLKLLSDNYRDSLMYSSNMPPSFEFHNFPQFVYLFENSPNFSDEDRRRAGELMRIAAEGMMDSWELVTPAEAYAVGKNKYFTNHYAFASRSTGTAARYLLSRYDMPQMQYFKAVAEHTLNSTRDVPLSPEDAGGYQYLVYRIFADYMLASGKLDSSIFSDPKYIAYMDYAKMSFNHLGYTAGYGDANPTGMRGAFVPMRENMEFTGDPEAAAIISLVGRTSGTTGFYPDSVRDWGIPLDLPLPSDPRFLGLRTFTVDQNRAKIMGMVSSNLPKLDKAIFRSSWNPADAEFLAINGLSGAPHGHDDAIGISQYVVGQHLWLYEGDYIRRAADDHNLVSVVRDGQAAMRQRNRIPAKERFAQLVGSAQSADKQMAATTLLLESNNGVNYYRHIGWEAGGGVWVIDELEAVLPGDYRFASRWRTTGEVQTTPQGALVRQTPANADDKLTNFTIAEGNGATRLGYSEFERAHGRGTGNLWGYPHSDDVTRTVLFWKDAKLQPGQRVFFANYFRAGSDAQPAQVQKLSENAFAVGSGADRRIAVIGSYTGPGGVESMGLSARAFFAGPRGTVAVDSRHLAPNTISALMTQQGEVVQNTTPTVPTGVAKASLQPLHQFDSAISYSADGKNHLAIGLANGEFILLKPDGSQHAKVKLPAEISAISAIPTANGELWAVGARPAQNTVEGAGTLHLIDATGNILWTKEVAASRGRQGTVRSIFPAHLDGADKPVSIIAGPESWRYAAYDLAGNERWFLEEPTHGAMAGAAGDLDGDGRDEVYAGAEYYYHTIVSTEGKKITNNTTSPRNYAAAIGDPDKRGINRIFASRSDGFLYSESLDKAKAPHWTANMGGSAHGIALVDSGIVAASLNGTITKVDGNGQRTGFAQLPAPLTDIKAQGNTLLAPGLDGRVYQVNAATQKLEKAWETGGYSEANLYFPKLVASGGNVFAAFGNRLYAVK